MEYFERCGIEKQNNCIQREYFLDIATCRYYEENLIMEIECQEQFLVQIICAESSFTKYL